MATTVIMPKFEMSQTTSTVVEWLKNEGDPVEKDEPLLNVETDKVTMEVEAPASGILAGIRVQPGEVVPVTQVIAYILAPGESLPTTAGDTPRAEGAKPAVVVSEAGQPAREVATTPVARRVAEAAGLDLNKIASPGSTRITRADVEAHLQSQETQKVRATPAAKRLAREYKVDLPQLTGSGPHGRIQADDVINFISVKPAVEPAVAAAPPVTTPAAEIIPLQGMRRTIAERLQRSAQEAPHVTFTLDIEMSQAQDLLKQLQTLAGPDLKVSMTALLTKAVGWTLLRHRAVNAHLIGDEIHRMPSANIGMAVALDNGLIVPVIREVETKGVLAIAAEVNRLSARAREGKLSRDEVTGGTFTISNLGMFGLNYFTAIINPPEVAILAVGQIARRVVVPKEADEPVVRPMMTVTLSIDHRVLDGAAAARFLADLQRVLEKPALLVA